MKSTAVMDDKGRLVIPKKVREELGASPGDAFYLRIRGRVMEVVRAQNPFDVLAEEAKREHERGQTVALEDVILDADRKRRGQH